MGEWLVPRFPYAERTGDFGNDRGRIANRGERDKMHAVGEFSYCPRGNREREPR